MTPNYTARAPRIRVFVLALAFLALVSAAAQAKTSISLDGPMLVLDSQDEAMLPRAFRTTAESGRKAASSLPSQDGLDSLRASSSGQFSELELRELMRRIPTGALILDLRQESHGFVSGTAVSWYGERNRANAGKTLSEIVEDEKSRLRELESAKAVGAVILGFGEKEREGAPESLVIPVKKVFAESDLVPFYGLSYARIPAQDTLGPRDEDVDAFLKLLATLPRDAWIHMHDNTGRGRAATYLAIFDIWRNAKNASYEDILKRQNVLGGNDLSSEGHTGRRVQEAKEREAFLKRFYLFAKEAGGDSGASWPAWNKSHPK